MSRSTGMAISGHDHLRQSLHDILTTRVGTRLCRRDYGSLVPELIDQPTNAATRLRLMNTIASAIIRWEPRVQVQQVQINLGDTAGQWVADLTLTIANLPDLARVTVPLGAAQ